MIIRFIKSFYEYVPEDGVPMVRIVLDKSILHISGVSYEGDLHAPNMECEEAIPAVPFELFIHQLTMY